jgi:hypothetical protein
LAGRIRKIPKAGTSKIVGKLPVVAPYVKYSAICEVRETDRRYASGKSAHPDNFENFEFFVIQVLEVSTGERLRVSDLRFVLKNEVGMGHLYESFLEEGLSRIALLSETDADANGKVASLRSDDVWDECYLNPDGKNLEAYRNAIEESFWLKMRKHRKIISAFPRTGCFLVRNLSSEGLENLRKRLSDRSSNWLFSVRDLEILEATPNPERFSRLLTDSYGKPFSAKSPEELKEKMKGAKDLDVNRRMVGYLKPVPSEVRTTARWKQLIDFYEKDIFEKLRKSGSTAAVLSPETLTKATGSPKYKDLFPLGSASLPEVLKILSDAKLVRETSAADVLSCAGIDSFLSRGRSVYFPKGLYVLESAWKAGEAALRRISELRDGALLDFSAPFSTGAEEEEGEGEMMIIKDEKDKKTFALFRKRWPDSESLIYALNEKLDDDDAYRFRRKDGTDCVLTQGQTSAVLASVFYSSVVLVGSPGTGKTLVVEALMDLFSGDDGEGRAVAVVTNGGCMAAELEARGIERAKTIHRCLEQRFSGKPVPAETAFDYDAVRVLVLDEFSNVSDDLAAAIYSPECFPNLRTVIHSFDPLQTGPVGAGSLATDYMQAFPKLRHHNRTVFRTASKIDPKSPLGAHLSEQLAACKTLGPGRDSAKTYFCGFVLAKIVSGLYRDPSLTSLYPYGVSVLLKGAKRFEEGSLVAKNHQIMLRGCREPFRFDDSTFVAYPCDRLFDEKVTGFLREFKRGSPVHGGRFLEAVSECAGAGGYPFVRGAMERNFGVEENWQALALTNDLCDEANDFYECLHSATFGGVGADEEDDGPFVVRALRPGSRVLVREHVPEKTVTCAVLDGAEKLGNLLRSCSRTLALTKAFTPNKTDLEFVSPSSEATGEKEEDEEEKDDESEDFVEKAEELVEDVSVEFEKEWKKNGTFLYADFESKVDAFRQVRSTPLYNGTTFGFLGVVDLRVSPLRAEEVWKFLETKQSLLEMTMADRLVVCKGKGSRAKRTKIRRWFISENAKLCSAQNMCDLVACLEEARWKTPQIEGFSERHFSRPKDAESRLLRSIGSSAVVYGPGEAKGYRRFVRGTGGVFVALDEKTTPVSLFKRGWAITVNFSQGKEYDEVDFLLPKRLSCSKEGRRLTDSVYVNFDSSHARVAATRSKKKFLLYGDPADFRELAVRNNENLTERVTFALPVLKAMVSALETDLEHRGKRSSRVPSPKKGDGDDNL